MKRNINTLKLIITLTIFLLLISTKGISSTSLTNQINKLCNKSKACDFHSRLQAYKPNYAIIQDTDEDEESIEVRYSFRYLLTRPHCKKENDYLTYSKRQQLECIKNFDTRWEAYFLYTGEFDFYAGTRHSGPVINRISNPGFHLRQIFNSQWRYVDFGVEHRSNGQVTEIDELDNGVLKTQIAFDEQNHEYFDGLSRGANFWILSTKYKFSDDAKLFLSSKFYIDDDSDVNWGPLGPKDISIEDYDRYQIIYSYTWHDKGKNNNKDVEATFEWLIGDKTTKTDSINIDINFPVGSGNFSVPLYIRFHSGPMNTLSNYTLDQKSIGIGIKLIPF